MPKIRLARSFSLAEFSRSVRVIRWPVPIADGVSVAREGSGFRRPLIPALRLERIGIVLFQERITETVTADTG
jgi:hypothetical protein